MLVGLFVGPAPRHRRASARCSGPSRSCGSSSSPCSGVSASRASRRRPGADQPACTPCASSRTTASTASSSSAPCSSSSPAARRCTRTWATSARRPIRLAWFAARPARRCSSTTSARARCCLPRARRRARIRSITWRRPGRSIRWSSLATAATVIASQAVISGAFSLTRQAVQLGLLPARARSIHTSADEIGQIYIPPRQLAC